MEETRYLGRSALQDGRAADWYLLAEVIPAGRFSCVCYGLRLEVPEGAVSEVWGITCDGAAIASLQAELAARQVPPEGLAAAAAAWEAQESSSAATLSAVSATAEKST